MWGSTLIPVRRRAKTHVWECLHPYERRPLTTWHGVPVHIRKHPAHVREAMAPMRDYLVHVLEHLAHWGNTPDPCVRPLSVLISVGQWQNSLLMVHSFRKSSNYTSDKCHWVPLEAGHWTWKISCNLNHNSFVTFKMCAAVSPYDFYYKLCS